MIDYNDIPDEVLTRYLERHELPDNEEGYERAARAGARELFHAWLCYEGFLGYTDRILHMVDTLRHIDKAAAPHQLPTSKQTVLDWLGELPLNQANYDLFINANAKRIDVSHWPLMVESLNTL